ncbi:Chromatin assembly factor 1 subunit [Malassezia cuniculi]|uniref:Chromatin assembly factor 1 subunit n=1 Tax=Malassezia cuniculi TaxID=948313 RepID=A0AAF0EYZ6_9BASI|nr:Chromatin assembly factor 1 subunit [Malassezia cuniculi]
MVRCVTFEIRWHDTLPIYSCSFQPISAARLHQVLDHNLGQAAGRAPGQTLSGAEGQAAQPLQAGGQSWRLATAGGDNNVRLWMVHPNVPSPAAIAAATGTSRPNPPRTEYLATLSRHTGVVNVVRFSPDGETLASAGDDGTVLFWVRSNRAFERDLAADIDERYEKEAWKVKTVTRATTQELYDLSWSPDGAYVAVGGTDFSVRVIDVQKGTVIREINDHQHYVQGLCWDPLGQLLATQSSDRSMHVYENNTARTKSAKLGAEGAEGADATLVPVHGAPADISKGQLAPPPPPIREGSLQQMTPPSQRLYGDDRYSGFFRRLGWSPDGSLLAAPSGQFDTGKSTGSVYIYARASLPSSVPVAVLPGHKCVTLVVRFSPILYKLRGAAAAFSLPYRMVYAVATQESVWVYDSQQSTPLYCFSNLHYASFTDLAWSSDGQTLMMSSSDGYCSVAVFDYNELGEPIALSEQPCLKTTIPNHDATKADNTRDIPQPDSQQPSGQASAVQAGAASVPTASSTDAPAASAADSPSTIATDAKPDSAAAPAAPNVPPSRTAAPSTDGKGPPKKRRVALTYEGPLPT